MQNLDVVKDIIGELINSGVGRAAKSMNELLNHKIQMSVPVIQILKLDETRDYISTFRASRSVPLPWGKPENCLQKSANRILFVDDEVMLTKMGKQLLTYQGYTVDTYNDPVMALENFRTRSRDYDLVITDMTMPTLSGLVLSRELKKIRDDIPIILCTGHNKLADDSKYADFGISALVLKPFVRKELIAAIEKVCTTCFFQ